MGWEDAVSGTSLGTDLLRASANGVKHHVGEEQRGQLHIRGRYRKKTLADTYGGRGENG